jgi:excinuclease ABC subunit B
MTARLETDFALRGDQPAAIAQLVEGLGGATAPRSCWGHRIRQDVHYGAGPGHREPAGARDGPQQDPRRAVVPGIRRFFPRNAVEFFVSYYDYYQPGRMPASDSLSRRKRSSTTEWIVCLSATRSLFERRDVIIVASVSCIYGLGSPESYYGLTVSLERHQRVDRDQILRKLVEIQYERNDHEFTRGTFRVRGDIVEVFPSYDELGLRIGLFGDEIDERRRSIRSRAGSCGASSASRSIPNPTS